MKQLTTHFALADVIFSSTATRLGIDNSLPGDLLDNVQRQADGLERMRDALGLHNASLHINSWYRCEALERLLCQKDYSAWCHRHTKLKDQVSWQEYFASKAHPRGYGTDFTCSVMAPPAQLVKWIADSRLQFDQLIEEGTWVHISFDPRLRRQVLSAHFAADGTPHYTVGE